MHILTGLSYIHISSSIYTPCIQLTIYKCNKVKSVCKNKLANYILWHYILLHTFNQKIKDEKREWSEMHDGRC